MAYGTIIQQGSFVSTGSSQYINLVSDVDWFESYNWTTTVAGVAATTGVNFYWQRGMAVNDGIVFGYNATPVWCAQSMLTLGVPGFSLISTSPVTLGAVTAVTGGTTATQPVYTTGNTGILSTGAIVRVFGTNQTNINGLDFSVDTVVANTSFRLANALQQAPGVTAGATGFYVMIAPSLTIYQNYYPKKRVIANITAANPAVVTTLVDHGYTTGQFVRMLVPSACGMTQLNNQLVTVTNINASTFSINVDTTNYTPFVFPLPAVGPFTPAEVIPVGEDSTVTTVNVLNDAFTDLNFRGIQLGAGVQSPAGLNTNVIYWKAGKSENV
jgi:hypothetical protein